MSKHSLKSVRKRSVGSCTLWIPSEIFSQYSDYFFGTTFLWNIALDVALDSRTIPTPKLTLTLTLTLTGGQFFSGAIAWLSPAPTLKLTPTLTQTPTLTRAQFYFGRQLSGYRCFGVAQKMIRIILKKYNFKFQCNSNELLSRKAMLRNCFTTIMEGCNYEKCLEMKLMSCSCFFCKLGSRGS